MRIAPRTLPALLLGVALACTGGAGGDTAAERADSAAAVTVPLAEAGPPPPAPVGGAPTASGAGTAQISFTGQGITTIEGEFPVNICAGGFAVDGGLAYQIQAGDVRITIGTENKQSGDVPLNTPDGSVNVTAIASGGGLQMVRGPRNGGSLRVSDDYRSAEAELELRSLMGAETARLVATITCQPAG